MVEIGILPSRALKLSVTEDGKQWLAERLADGHGEAVILRDLLEPYWANGQFHPFEGGEGNPAVGLTNAPCIAEALQIDEAGERTVQGKLWWFPQYERVGPLESLCDEGFVVFSLAPDEMLKEGRGRCDAGGVSNGTSTGASIGFAEVTGERFFLITDCEKVETLKARTYEQAFAEIETRGGMTWVASEEALSRLSAECAKALGQSINASDVDPVTSGWLAALATASHSEGLEAHAKGKVKEILVHFAQLPQARAVSRELLTRVSAADGLCRAGDAADVHSAADKLKTMVCLSTVTYRVLHEADACIDDASLTDVARMCSDGDWMGGCLTVTTSARLTRAELEAAAGELGGDPDFFGSQAETLHPALEELATFMQDHREVLDELGAQLPRDPQVQEDLDDWAAELKDQLGATMANDESEEWVQEEVICQAEDWVTNHVINAALQHRLAAPLWLKGEAATRAWVAATQERQAAGRERVQRPGA